MSVVRLNRVTCLPGRGIELERRLAQVVDATTTDLDCEAYSWLRSDASGERATYFNFSRWRTREGRERHLASKAVKAFTTAERADPCLGGPPEHARS